MSDPDRADIEALVQQGLDAYGVGDTDRAIACFEEVLRADPGHVLAGEYLEIAQGSPTDDGPEPPAAPEPAPDPFTAESLLRDARELLREHDPETALDHLLLAGRLEPHRDEIDGYIDMVRSQLLKRYRERIGDLGRVPRIVADAQAIKRYNLAAEAGFLLSLIDGSTPVESLLSLAGMDAFESLRILNRLLDVGIAEFEP